MKWALSYINITDPSYLIKVQQELITSEEHSGQFRNGGESKVWEVVVVGKRRMMIYYDNMM